MWFFLLEFLKYGFFDGKFQKLSKIETKLCGFCFLEKKLCGFFIWNQRYYSFINSHANLKNLIIFINCRFSEVE
jgi:hypothetical protein